MTLKNNPKVSVLMPIYNTKEEYLRTAVESVLNQTFKDFELILLNDASPDKNVAIVAKEYVGKDKRVRYEENPKNMGISKSRNKLLDMATGEYLAIMDHDDISLPDRLMKQVKVLDDNQNIGVVSCFYKNIGSDKIHTHPVDSDDIVKHLFFSCEITHSATMLRKSVLTENHIRYEEEFSPCEDYALFCRLIGKTEFYNIPEVLFNYRDFIGNTSHKQSKRMKRIPVYIRDFARKDNQSLWNRVMTNTETIIRINLFGIIPIVKIKSHPEKSVYYLFGVIPCLTKKNKITLSKDK